MKINDAAAVGFERGADDYERARPGYPREAIDLVVEKLPIGPRSQVCDLAAGTGKLTRELIATGARIVAVEPVEAMRRQLAVVCPDVTVLDGTAEAIPLADQSVDALCVAQAFHWFDAPAALAEIHRVLRPGGGFALIWNVRDESVDWVRRFTEIIVDRAGGRPYTPYHFEATGAGGESTRADHVAVVASNGGFTAVSSARFDNPQTVTPDDVVARAASTSFVAALPQDSRTALLGEIRELVATHPETTGWQRFVFPHHTDVSWCQRR